MNTIVVQAGREKKLRNFYPWAYSEDIAETCGDVPPGEIVEARDSAGSFIARGFYNPRSHIPFRLLTDDPREEIDARFFHVRIESALARRRGKIFGTDAYRLVHAEADQIPGLIADRFGDFVVMQIRNAGLENFREAIRDALVEILNPRGIFERSDVEARAEEGLPERVGVLWGEVPETITIHEDDLDLTISVTRGQKTGFYLDQRDNRRLWRSTIGARDRCLDVYAYTGAFSLHAARQGANSLAVDKDADALQMLEVNARALGLANQIGLRWGDALEGMQNLAAEKRTFTRIVLDPPTLVKHKNDVPLVKRVFIDMVKSALALLEPNGRLFLSTCAYHIRVDDLIEIARIAANDAHRRAEVLAVTYQPADHPWILQIPETLYLKTLVLRM
jgi:23S rRNA (cytosine1962-C5)-methyltransferase